jgi:imidazolonepropionase-like amidohydrolase
MNRTPFAARRAAVFALALLPLALFPLALPRLAAAQAAAASAPVYQLLHTGMLIDGTGKPARRNVDVLVKDGRIEQVGASLSAPPGSEEIDLRRYTVLPGLIDCHTHLTSEPAGPDAPLRAVTRGPADAAIGGVNAARKTLEAGFTTVRNVGAGAFVDVALKRAIDAGTIPGPRMITATNGFSIVGGHGDANGYEPGVLEEHLDYTEGLPTGPDECRKAVRYAHKHGAGVIKIMSTGGVLSANDALAARQFSDAELAAIVEEATLLGLKVCCHAHGSAGMLAAIEAGVASIEHGTFLDEACIRAMKRRGTYLVPTRSAGEWVFEKAQTGELPRYAIPKALEVGPVMRKSFQDAYRAGVKIAFGTDAGVFPHGRNAREFRFLTDLGMKPMDAIVSATGGAADLLGWPEVGTIEPGRYADFVVVDGDPLADVRLLESPVAVLKGGVFAKDARSPDTQTSSNR